MSHFYEKTISKEADENRRVGAGMLQRERSSVVMAFAAGVMVTMALSAAWPAATIESALAQQSYSRMERLPRPATTVASALSQDRRPQQNEHMRMYLTPCLANVEDVSMKVAITNKVGNPMKRSDKCDGHSYHFAYHRYISPLAEEFFSGAREKVKVLEIGLGCYQGNTGAGVRMWNDIFKNSQGRKLDLHVMEYDAECAHLWAREWVKRFHHINLRIFTGDQSNEAKLREILSEGRGEYDAIVDDGGHTMLQQQVSLRVLFPALKPGGFYTVEDLETSYYTAYGGKDPRTGVRQGGKAAETPFVMTEALGAMVAWMTGDRTAASAVVKLGLEPIMPLVEHIDCYPEICVLQKYGRMASVNSSHVSNTHD